MLYVFVDIKIDTAHFIETLKYNFEPGKCLALVSTIQFVTALQVSLGHIEVKHMLLKHKQFYCLTKPLKYWIRIGLFTKLNCSLKHLMTRKKG